MQWRFVEGVWIPKEYDHKDISLFQANEGNLVVLWLDMVNAYGSLPHKLVEEALMIYNIPAGTRDLILDYYSDFQMKVSAGSVISDWHKLEV